MPPALISRRLVLLAQCATAAAFAVEALHALPPLASSVVVAGCMALLAVAFGAAAATAGREQRAVYAAGAVAFGGSLLARALLTAEVAAGGPVISVDANLRVFLAVTHPAIIAGLITALDVHWRRPRFEGVVDTLLLVVAAIVVDLLLPYGPLLHRIVPPAALLPDPSDRVVFALWRVATAVELFLVALLLLWRGGTLGLRAGIGAALGTMTFAAANALTARALLAPDAQAATAADPFWLLCALFFSFALPRGAAPGGGSAASPGRVPADTALRGGSLVAAVVICSVSALSLGFHDHMRPGLAVMVGVFGALSALRLAHAFYAQRRETLHLTSSVEAEREMSAALEQRVAVRTAELAEAERVLQRMWVLGQHISLELHPARVLQRFAEAVMDVAQADGGLVGLVHDDGAVRVAAALGDIAPLQGTLIPVEGSIVGRVVRARATWHSEDVTGDPAPLHAGSARLLAERGVPPVRGMVVVPIQRRGETIGALALVTREPRRFTAADLARIESLTDMLGVALANAELVETLRQAEWRFRTLFRAAPDAVLTVLPSGRVREANDAVREIVGLDPAQVVGRPFASLVRPEDRPALDEALRRALAGRPARLEVRCLRQLPPGGSESTAAAGVVGEVEERVVALAASRLPEADPPTVLVIARDTTAEREMRARLMETERLAAVGELVAGVAHEVNNPLSSISAFAQLLLRDGGLSQVQRESVDVIRSETVRASQVVKDLLAFARRSEPQREPVDLNDLVERTLRLRGYQLTASNVEVVLDLAPDLPAVMGDARQLQQVILNLVTNSIQAMSGQGGSHHGTLRVTTRAVPRGAPARAADGAGAGAADVRIEVADTGPGIPAGARPHVFEPFFTTKPEGEGTGLGLSVSYGIVSAHDGRLELAETSSRGTRFVVTLPAAPDGSDAERAKEAAPAAPRSPLAGLRLLFVDDEPSLRSGMLAFGRLRGFSVVTADEGRAALEAVQRTAFDAVVCDLRMPGMGGHAFHDALLQERPGLARRTVFITGDVVGTTARPSPASRQPTLTKPFSFEKLEEALVAVIRS